jgi:hypothetical protein
MLLLSHKLTHPVLATDGSSMGPLTSSDLFDVIAELAALAANPLRLLEKLNIY